MTSSELDKTLVALNENTIISDPEKNLRSKIDSICRSIDSLSAKRERLNFEIKRQKKSLERKRLELKKSHKHLRSETAFDVRTKEGMFLGEEKIFNLGDIDDYLLQKSSRILDE